MDILLFFGGIVFVIWVLPLILLRNIGGWATESGIATCIWLMGFGWILVILAVAIR